jgi:hypothetical protein
MKMRGKLLSRIALMRNLPWYFWPAVIIAIAFVIVAVRSAISGHVDWAGFLINFAVLAIAFAALLATLPTPATLWIERQYELEISDVIFYLYDEANVGKVPRDIVFQIHVSVANVGGRKAVLSALRFEAVLDRDGSEIRIPGFTLPVLAQRVQQGGGFRIEDNVIHHHRFQDFIQAPYVLEPDDVITMRLRARPCVDWSKQWTLDRIRQLATALQQPIAAVRVTAIYRRGRDVVQQGFVVKGLTVLQQELYVSQLETLTDDFQALPPVGNCSGRPTMEWRVAGAQSITKSTCSAHSGCWLGASV